ncbi:MAG TPA: hypothetical protein VEK08_18125 [Planctomycetota bacterium]|nr:hypothetical protein [Planctomycetota bacterium]
MSTNLSIGSTTVTFLKVMKKHVTAKARRTRYKLLADVSTVNGNERQAYWFGDDKSFLRQREQDTGKTTIKVDCSAKQRAAIKKLVKAFEAHAAR